MERRFGISMCMMLFTLAVVGVFLSRPLYDPDFFWHLKTGQWLWEHAALPHTDPFGIPPFPEPSARYDFILTSYWLIQLILYAFYSLFGMTGIIAFRWCITGLSLLICAGWVNIRNSKVLAVLAIGAMLILELYFIERPQFVSFVCFGALLAILLRFCEQPAGRTLWSLLVPLSLVMLLWSNMHGGFLIGQAILMYYVSAEGGKFLHASLSPLSAHNYKILLISSLAALAASCVNPNAINVIKYLPTIFDANNYANLNVMEEMSVIEYYKVNNDFIIFLYCAVVAVTACALALSSSRKNITVVGILAGTAFMGCLHMRLMPFFLVSATLFLAKYFETECSSIKGNVLLMLMLAVTAVYCLSDEPPRVRQAMKSGWVPAGHFPVNAADYILSHKISGNIYTAMYWGGYLIWRTGPESRMFYDGRMLNLQRAWEYNNSQKVAMNRRPYWKGLFTMYDIQTVVLPRHEFDGSPHMLTQSISADKEWALVFDDESEAVFVRKAAKLHYGYGE